jgi:hypothetical protein
MDMQQAPNAILTGRITTLQGRPLAGAIVRVYQRDRSGADHPIGGDAVTDAGGRYLTRFALPHYPLGGGDPGGAGVFIRASEGNRVLGESPVTRIDQTQITIDLKVDYAGADPQEPARRVSGVVRDPRGHLLPNVTVKVVDRDLRTEQPLGQAQTDDEGAYQIEYFARQFRRREKGSADLVVHALDAYGTALAASPVLFNAPPSAEVNLTIPAETLLPPNLFERIAQALVPVTEGYDIEELEEDDRHQDLTFLAGETGFDRTSLARFVFAQRLEHRGVQAEFWFVLLGGGLYEYRTGPSLREQFAEVVSALPSIDEADARKALARGFNEKEIADSFRTSVNVWVESFLELVAAMSLSDRGRPTFVAAALDDAGIKSAEKREGFARLFNQHKALTPELIDALKKEQYFTRAEIADLRTSFRLADLTRGDFSVVRMVKSELDAAEPERIRTLAKRSRDQWVRLVERNHGAGKVTLPFEVHAIAGQRNLPEADVYGSMLERQFREAFPTTAFAGGLERALGNGGSAGLRKPKELYRFLERYEDFDLLTTSVDEFLKEGVRGDLRAVARDDEFRVELKAVQRVFKLAPTFEATDTLLGDGIHSGQQVYRMGESAFVRQFENRPGFTPPAPTRRCSPSSAT